MWGWGNGMGMVPFGWMGVGIWGVILAGVVVAIVFVVRSVGRRGWTGRGESALDILQKRYARGEISKEEFEEMKRTLG